MIEVAHALSIGGLGTLIKNIFSKRETSPDVLKTTTDALTNTFLSIMKEVLKDKGNYSDLQESFTKRIQENENEINEFKEIQVRKQKIQLVQEFSQLRKQLAYFYKYYYSKKDILLYEIDDEEEVEERIAFELFKTIEQRINASTGENTSIFCPSIFEIYSSLESTIISSNFFWTQPKEERSQIIQLFDVVQNYQVEFDTDEIDGESIVYITNELLKLYESFNEEYEKLLAQID